MKKRVWLIGLCFIVAHAMAASAVESLTSKLSGFQSLTASFTQKVSAEDRTVLQTSSGKFALQRPGQFFWQVNKPITQELITDGKTLWVYEPDLEQVTIHRLGSDLTKTPLALLTKQHLELAKSFNISEPKADTFVLLPKSNRDNFNKIILVFSKNKPSSLVLFDRLGQQTSIRFSQVVINPKLKSSLFHFKVPAGVDVVDMRK